MDERQKNTDLQSANITEQPAEVVSGTQSNKPYRSRRDALVHVEHEVFRGPIPHPDILKGYERIAKGSANRIISMAENEAKHRHEIETRASKADSRDSLLGIIAAFLIAAFILACGTFIAVRVQNIAGVIAGTLLDLAGIGTIVGTFLTNTRPKNEDEKMEGPEK